MSATALHHDVPTAAEIPKIEMGRDIHLRTSELASKLRPGVVERELNRELPFESFRLFKESGLGAVRLPAADGTLCASVRDVAEIVVELAAADSNVAHALRSHFNFVELQVTNPAGVAPRGFVDKIREGAIFGGAHTELGTSRPGEVKTTLNRQGDTYLLNGRKFYTTGTAFSDWVSVSALMENGQVVWVLIPTDRAGVQIRDDWNGMGQRLTASGGTDFQNVIVYESEITGRAESSFAGRHASTFRQLYLAACVAGIVRNALHDSVLYVKTKARPITHSHSDTAKGDYFVQEAVGELASLTYVIERAVFAAADSVDVAHTAIIERRADADSLLTRSAIEVAEAQAASANLALQAATKIFDTGGASATSRALNYDRHWRNIRTLLSHNPVSYKKKVIGNYLLNDEPPPVDGGFF